ncbi:glycosyltransferase family 4 protein [Oceanobacillus senegalensis]|uniref:glycosyltransferase family 4 protein n=1 Tax=Oceanobacillus senegalensis TaxID=1936063 RepID=UPI000A305E6A|nr:MraY family glycosyltransferase [Oceanobacillus senegalensis]
MINYVELVIALCIAILGTFLLTYPVKWFAIKIDAVDRPNQRKIHKKVMPRLGGLAIFLGAFLGVLYLRPEHDYLPEIWIGAIVILITGAIDDKYTISPVVKLTGQFVATSFLVSSGLFIDRITLPFFGVVELGLLSVIVTVVWVIGITNAINLIDGLDGLASGVTTIALISIFIMSIIDMQWIVTVLCIAMIGANIGFLFHNFHPAKIYMGDSGSNFLGFMIAVISMLGLFKNLTFFSFIVPIIVLAVPIFDTLFAIYRRAINNESIMQADNKHVHYQLLKAGFSHRKTVLIIYMFSALFGMLAILFSNASMSTLLIVFGFVILLLHLFAEVSGTVGSGRKPMISTLDKIFRGKRRTQ